MGKSLNHLFHYGILLIILVIAIGFSKVFSADKMLGVLVALVLSICYAIYGIAHHYIEHDLTLKIVVEYALVALLVIALAFFVKGGF